MSRLKDLCRQPAQYGLNITPDSYQEAGVRLLRTSDIREQGQLNQEGVYLAESDVPAEYRLQGGDVLFSRSGTIGRCFLYDPAHHGGCTFAGFLVRFRLAPQVDPRAIGYWSQSAGFQEFIQADAVESTIMNFNAERYANLAIPPRLMEASRPIADYLDAETARIDHVAAAIERSLSLLTERRTSVLLSAFEQKERSAARARVLALAEVVLGRQRSPEQADGPYMTRYLRAANVKDGRLDLSDVMEMNFTPVEQQRFALRPGDVLISEGAGSLAAVGAAAVWKGELEGTVCIQNTLVRLRPRKGMDPSYVAWWARFAYESGLFASVAGGANIYHLGAETVGRLACPVPTLDRQCEIATRLDNDIAALEREMDLRRQQVSLLQERREALITAAVTGQIEIPGVAA